MMLRTRPPKVTTMRTREFTDDFPTPNIGQDMADLCMSIREVKEDGSNFQEVLPENFVGKFFYDGGDHPKTEVMVVVSTHYGEENYLAIIFRGSDSSRDWLINTNTDLVHPTIFDSAPETVKIHRGLYEAVFSENMGHVLSAHVMNSGIRNIYISGHSQGGASAHIFGAYLAEKFPKHIFTMINFGAPSFGNLMFKYWTERRLTNLAAWRVVYQQDICPRMLPMFVHAGHLIQIDRFSTSVYYQQIGHDDFAGVPERWWYSALSFRHHKLKRYAKFFRKKAKKNLRHWPSKFEQVKWFTV